MTLCSKHEFEYVDSEPEYTDDGYLKTIKIYECKKCGKRTTLTVPEMT